MGETKFKKSISKSYIHFTPARVAYENQVIPRAGGNVKSLWKTAQQFLKQTHIKPPHDSTFPFLRIYLPKK